MQFQFKNLSKFDAAALAELKENGFLIGRNYLTRAERRHLKPKTRIRDLIWMQADERWPGWRSNWLRHHDNRLGRLVNRPAQSLVATVRRNVRFAAQATHDPQFLGWGKDEVYKSGDKKRIRRLGFRLYTIKKRTSISEHRDPKTLKGLQMGFVLSGVRRYRVWKNDEYGNPTDPKEFALYPGDAFIQLQAPDPRVADTFGKAGQVQHEALPARHGEVGYVAIVSCVDVERLPFHKRLASFAKSVITRKKVPFAAPEQPASAEPTPTQTPIPRPAKEFITPQVLIAQATTLRTPDSFSRETSFERRLI